MNVTVIRLKDLLKYLVVTGVTLMVIAWTTSFFNHEKNDEKSVKLQSILQEMINKVENKSMNFILGLTIPVTNMQNEQEIKKDNGTKKILNMQLAILENTKFIKNEKMGNKQEEIQKDEEENIELAKTDVTTEAVQENNIEVSYTDEHGSLQIKNQSSYEVTEDLFTTDYEFTNTKEVLIFHTHTCESYTPSENYNYEMTGTYRTTDLNYSVARVGDELDKQLTEYGYNVTHDTTYHDYPAYNGSYDRSQETVKNILTQNPEIQTVIDLHRDAVGASNEYAPSVLIDGESCAQLMIVLRYRRRRTIPPKLETKL